MKQEYSLVYYSPRRNEFYIVTRKNIKYRTFFILEYEEGSFKYDADSMMSFLIGATLDVFVGTL